MSLKYKHFGPGEPLGDRKPNMTEKPAPDVVEAAPQEKIKVRVKGEPFLFPAHMNARAQRNHSQSLKRLEERGGLCWSEALAIVKDRGLFDVKMSEADAEREFRAALQARPDAALVESFREYIQRLPQEWADAANEGRADPDIAPDIFENSGTLAMLRNVLSALRTHDDTFRLSDEQRVDEINLGKSIAFEEAARLIERRNANEGGRDDAKAIRAMIERETSTHDDALEDAAKVVLGLVVRGREPTRQEFAQAIRNMKAKP